LILINSDNNNNNNNNNQITTTLYEYSNFITSSYNYFFHFITFSQRGNAYVEKDSIYDKDKHPVFHFNNPEETFSKLFQVPFKKKSCYAMFQKI
jgi:hypothetical protein